jgi:hypothetical protein
MFFLQNLSPENLPLRIPTGTPLLLVLPSLHCLVTAIINIYNILMIFKSLCNRTKNATSEGHKQKDSPGFSFLMSYTSRSPGLNLFDSSVSDSEISSDQVK